MTRSDHGATLVPDVLLMAYEHGFFPMAESSDGRILWHRPDPRGIIPLDDLTLPRSLQKLVRRGVFTVTINAAFSDVIQACSDREETWINRDIIDAYTELHDLGYAHSIECWQDGQLVGGLYGVAIGGAFFGESMFTRVSNASKVAFAHLIAHLRQQQFRLLDTQYVNDFTVSLGAIEIPDALYQVVLNDALRHAASFLPPSEESA